MPVAAESCGRCGPIVQSFEANRAVVEVQTCSRLRAIVRSLKFKRAVNLIRILSQFLQS